jgi:hypothetical protein
MFSVLRKNNSRKRALILQWRRYVDMRKLMRKSIAAKRCSHSFIDFRNSIEGEEGDREDDMIKYRRVFKSLRRFLNKYKHGCFYDKNRFDLPKQLDENIDKSMVPASSSNNKNKMLIASCLRKRLELTDITIMAEKTVILKWILLIKRRSVYVSQRTNVVHYVMMMTVMMFI